MINLESDVRLFKEGKFINVVENLTIFISKKNADGSYSDIYLDDATKIDKETLHFLPDLPACCEQEAIVRSMFELISLRY